MSVNVYWRNNMENIIKMASGIFKEGTPLPDVLHNEIDPSDEKSLNILKEIISYIYTEKMPFNKFLGIELVSIDSEEIILKFPLKEELIGNYVKQFLHGGVISAVIDLAGGVAVQFAALQNMKNFNLVEMQKRFSVMSTIDMRIDFLRPGKGETFFVKSSVVRAGYKVSVVRSSFNDEKGRELAIGTASYMVG